MAAPAASLLSPSATFRMAAFVNSAPCSSCKFPALILPSAFREVGSQLLEYPRRRDARRVMTNVSTVETPVVEETKECSLPTWAEFDIGKAPVFWKTMNGLPPTSGEKLTIFYNPAASNLVPNDDFGIAFNGGFNQPIMCGGEPRSMTIKKRGSADPPIYVIKLCIPQHAIKLIFSFTNGTDWDGPYSLPFEVPKKWKNKPSAFFNEGLAEELGVEGACEKAIYPDSHVVIMRCAMVGNLSTEGGDRCNLDIVSGCTDPGSPNFNAFADVDDGSCPVDEELESEEK